jgi:HEAT repeat protein
MFEPPTTERLIYLLRSYDPEARVDAARQLAERSSDPVTHEALYEASFKRDQRIRAIAARSLNDYPDDRTLVRLVDLLSDRNSAVRLAAAEALRDLDDASATLPLIEALSDRNRWVVLAAMAGLERFGSSAARRPLRKMIGSKDQGISQAARQALAAIEARDQ